MARSKENDFISNPEEQLTSSAGILRDIGIRGKVTGFFRETIADNFLLKVAIIDRPDQPYLSVLKFEQNISSQASRRASPTGAVHFNKELSLLPAGNVDTVELIAVINGAVDAFSAAAAERDNTDYINRAERDVRQLIVSVSAGPVSAIQIYLREISQASLLTDKRINELFKGIEEGNEDAQRIVFESNLRLVVSLARRYNFSRQEDDLLDLIQEGSLGLSRAIQKFDRRRGYRFSTYAWWWIRQTILKSFVDKGRTIRLPTSVVAEINRMKREKRKLEQEFWFEPTQEQLAERMDISVERIWDLRQWSQAIESLDVQVSRNENPGSVFAEMPTLGETIVDEASSTVEEVAEGNILRSEIRKALSQLTTQEQQVISLRFGLAGIDYEPKEISRILKIDEIEVRNIIDKGLRKLRSPGISRRLKVFLPGDSV